jgi:hypothetical protein
MGMSEVQRRPWRADDLMSGHELIIMRKETENVGPGG